jgi:hypothetical protein
MREMKKPFTAGLALLTLLATAGCYEFDAAFEQCLREGRCTLPDGGLHPEADAGGDGGQGDGGTPDSGCIPTGGFDLPDDAWQDTNCDGVDGTIKAAIFVDPVGGYELAEGTPEAPVKSLQEALAKANTEGLEAVYLAQGVYTESGLELTKPISLYGGYTGVSGGWTRDGGPGRLNGGTIGLTVRDVSFTDGGLLVIERLNITSAPGAAAGEPSIGMRVMDSNGIHLRQLTVTAGRGATGQQGLSPQAPSQGPNGQPGATGSSQTTAPLPGGQGGSILCAGEAVAGGRGGTSTQFEGGGTGSPGTPGNTDGGSGGSYSSTTCTATGCQASPGLPGAAGSEGPAGMNGDAGSNLGMLNGETWVAALARGGTPGQPGRSGGGGGGGSYCAAGAGGWGGSGGGGGGGGCGGAGGLAGGGGGASIGLLLLRGHVQLERVTVETRGGGAGGAGGTGAGGGPGGQGANGGTGTPNGTVQPCVGGNGGPGGHGGPGGPGGHGGNGGGGPSIALWCDNAASSSALRDGGSRLLVAAPGAPGTGPGAPADAGVSTTVYGCQ